MECIIRLWRRQCKGLQLLLLSVLLLQASSWKLPHFCKQLMTKSSANVIIASQLLSLTITLPANAAPEKFFGLQDGRLLKCRTTSNCISSSSVSSLDKYGRPWKYSINTDEQFQKLQDSIKSDPFLKLVEVDSAHLYLHAEAKSAFPPGSTDDLEFLLNDGDKIIKYRSNSREVVSVGGQLVGDAGANRNRLASIQQRLGLEEMDMDDGLASYLKATKSRSFLDQLRISSQPSDINFVDNSVPEN